MMQHRALYLLLLFLVGITYTAKAQKEMPLYEGAVPGTAPCAVKEEWGTSAGGRQFVKHVTTPSLTVFLPEQNVSNATAVIICPGGGYSMLSIGDGGYDAAKELAKSGIVAFVLKYRTVDTVCNTQYALAPLHDVQQAIYVVRANAAKWKIDLHKVGLLGFSAGGHLVAMAATKYNAPQIDAKGFSLRPDFTILAYPVISFMDSLTSRKTNSRHNLLGKHVTEQQKIWYSPELNVDAQTPPSYITQATDDSTVMVENSIAYYEALKKNKVSAKLIIYQKGGHGFATYNKAEDDHWLPYAVKWMKLNGF